MSEIESYPEALPQDLNTIRNPLDTEFLKITAPDGTSGDVFGYSVSLSGDTMVVGACLDGPGSAYVFERNYGGSDNWGEVTKLTASDGALNDYFGWSVSINGDTIVVGSFFDDVGGRPDQGSAYVFERDYGGPDNWGEIKKLTASNGLANDRFGSSVSVFGDTIIVGAYGDDVGASDQGSAYVYERNLGGSNFWGEVTQLTASDGAATDYFGVSACIYGDTAVVGAYGDDIGATTDQGSVYVFERDWGGPGNWGERIKKVSSDGGTFDFFGNSVSVSGDILVVGAYYADVGGSSWQGAAYVFERDLGGTDNWGEVTKLTAGDGSAFDYFGNSVSIYGDTAVIGSYYDDVGANGDQGSAYVYGRDEGGTGNWGQVTTLTASDGAASDMFGNSVSVFGDTIVSGANGDDIGASTDQGSAYIFRISLSYNILLNEGWNLVSLPLTQQDTSIDNALNSILGKWDCIQAYNTTDHDHWKTNSTFRPYQLNDLDSLDHRIGFWINITESGVILTVNGNVSGSTNILLYAGWNLVGYPTLTKRTIQDALAGTGYDVPVEGFNASAPYRIFPLADTYMMQPGEGYWVHVPADTVWVVDW
jgi:hypothetical protein